MIRADNCIYFDEELSNIYDQTRPFRPRMSSSPVLLEICRRLIDAQPEADSITLLDVGAGTGRVTIPLANHYERIATDREHAPKLTIYCVEKSSSMLQRLQAQIGDSFENVSIDAKDVRDIRDLMNTGLRFDGVIAHWLFHVVSDWRVAIYAIDRLLKSTAQVFLLSEESDLYRAIDGDYKDIEQETVNNLWHDYHRGRSEIALELSMGTPILPPRFRLGSMVIDDRVEQMFVALGWTEYEEFQNKDSWTNPMSLEFVINNVIRPRAFTNMRLLPQKALARSRYDELANRLLNELTPGEKNFNWQIETSFTARVLRRPSEDRNQGTSRELMLHVLRDTLGRRWKRRMEHAYNRNALWRRLFATTWERLNSLDGSMKPCGALGNKTSGNIQALYANAPFADVGEEGKACIVANCSDDVSNSYIEGVWRNLTMSIETHEPFCVCFLGRIHKEQGERVTTPERRMNTESSEFHPHIHSVEISEEEEALLLGISEPGGCLRAEGPVWDSCMSLRTGGLRGLVERGRQLGIVPFHDRDAQTRFILGLAQIAHCNSVAVVYAFPFRADFQGSEAETLGMCVYSGKLIPTQALEFLWSMNDIIFNEYLEDVLTDMELHLHEEANHTRGPAKAAARILEPVSAEKWRDINVPAVLVVVSTKLELETLIDLSGTRDSLEHRRKKLGSVYRHELGLEGIPVWAVSTARAGSGTPGGSLSTVLSSIGSLPYKPYAVIMPGIAFGLQKRKQRLGDVLVSDRICAYEMQKLNPRVKINRDVKPSATPELIRLLQSCELDWNHETPELDRPIIDYGLMMSGEKLVNDPEFVAELLDREPEALGGEMEAAGLYAGALEFSVRWIMMKGICDWGMGKGDKYQKVAALNSIDFMFHVLQQPALIDAIRQENAKLLGE
ncbi:MAG: methyltransferase [Candidatus Thiodiazotropha sp.]